MRAVLLAPTVVFGLGLVFGLARGEPPRPRLRDWGIAIGALPPGPLDAITDVPGVRVGQVTVARGAAVNTGVTAILPHERNLFRDKVRAAIVVGNAFGKLTGARQVNELGELVLRAQPVRGARGTAEALPLDRVRRPLQDHRVLPPS